MDSSAGNALSALGGFLAGLNLSDSATIADVEGILDTYLSGKGIVGRFDGIQHGQLTVIATPANASLLKYEIAALLERIHQAGHTDIAAIRVRVDRAPRR